MNEADALKLLGLEPGASLSEIESVHAEKRRQARQSAISGDASDLVQTLEALDQARDTLAENEAPEPAKEGSIQPRTVQEQAGVSSASEQRDSDEIPYELRREVGFAGPGRLFNAIHKETGAPALIFLLDEGTFANRSHAEAYARAVQVQEAPKGNNIVRGKDAGHTESGAWVALPPLRGAALDTILKIDGTIDARRAVFCTLEVASALREMQGSRPHGDLRPGTVWVGQAGQVQVLDLLFTSLRELADPRVPLSVGEAPRHTAPELHLSGEQPSEQSDQFALAQLADRLLEASGDREIAGRIGPVIERASARDPSARYPSANAFADAIRTELRPHRAHTQGNAPETASSRGLKLGIAGLVAVLVLAAVSVVVLRGLSGSEEPAPQIASSNGSTNSESIPPESQPASAETTEQPESESEPESGAVQTEPENDQPQIVENDPAELDQASLSNIGDDVAQRLEKNKERIDELLRTWDEEVAASWSEFPLADESAEPYAVSDIRREYNEALSVRFENDIQAEQVSTKIRAVGSKLSDQIDRFSLTVPSATQARASALQALSDSERWFGEGNADNDPQLPALRNTIADAMVNLREGNPTTAGEHFDSAARLAMNRVRSIRDRTDKFEEDLNEARRQFDLAETIISTADSELQRVSRDLEQARRDLDAASDNARPAVSERVAKLQSDARVWGRTAERLQGGGRVGDSRASARRRLAEWDGVARQVASQETEAQLSDIRRDVRFLLELAQSVEPYERLAAPAGAARDRWMSLPRFDELPGSGMDLQDLYEQEAEAQDAYRQALDFEEQLDFTSATAAMERALNWFDRNSRQVQRAWLSQRQTTIGSLRDEWSSLWEPLEGTRFKLPQEIAEAESLFVQAESAVGELRFVQAEEAFAEGIAMLQSQVDAVATMMLEADATDARGRTPLHIAAERGEIEQIRNQLALGARLTAKDNEGLTAFDLAARANRIDSVEVLMDPVRENGWRLGNRPVLFEAVAYPDSFLYILELGAPPFRVYSGETVLFQIARSKARFGVSPDDQIRMAKEVLRRSESVLNKKSAGRTALDEARQTGASELYSYLRSVGGRSGDE